jgi:hypothetical protein
MLKYDFFFLDTQGSFEDLMVPFHVDNGLYLILTPFPNHGLQIKTSTGSIVNTDNLDSNSVLVLMGRGLADWLLQNKPVEQALFHPVPHAVGALKDNLKTRSIYARMKIAPPDGKPVAAEAGSRSKTFEDIFFNIGHPTPDRLCAISLTSDVKKAISK